MATWHTPDSLRDVWRDAPVDDAVVEELLVVSKVAVIAYAPALDENDTELDRNGEPVQTVPENYRWAQVQQARNIWNASTVQASGGMGYESFTITPKPLDWAVRQMLRPRQAVPVVG